MEQQDKRSDKILFKIKERDPCPKCGSETSIKSGQHGPFLGCLNYPACDFTQPLKARVESQIIKELPDSHCSICQSPLVVRQGKFGIFISCQHYPECHYTVSVSDDSSLVAQKEPQNEDDSIRCPKCDEGYLLMRHSRFGKAFWGCSSYPKCQFLVNSKPVSQTCPECGMTILIEKKRSKGTVYACANKRCSYETRIEKSE